MRYSFEKLSGRTRLMIMVVLLILTVLLKVTEHVPDFFSGFLFGLLIIFVVAEIAIYRRRKNTNS